MRGMGVRGLGLADCGLSFDVQRLALDVQRLKFSVRSAFNGHCYV